METTNNIVITQQDIDKVARWVDKVRRDESLDKLTQLDEKMGLQ